MSGKFHPRKNGHQKKGRREIFLCEIFTQYDLFEACKMKKKLFVAGVGVQFFLPRPLYSYLIHRVLSRITFHSDKINREIRVALSRSYSGGEGVFPFFVRVFHFYRIISGV